VIEAMFGLSFDKPLRQCANTSPCSWPLLTEGKADVDGETISTHIAIEAADNYPCRVIVARSARRCSSLAGTVRRHLHVDDGPATLASHTVPLITAARNGQAGPRPASSRPADSVTNDGRCRARRRASERLLGLRDAAVVSRHARS